MPLTRSQRMARLLGICAVAYMLAPTRTATAIVIDDFSVGPITVAGPSVQTQSGLDPAHVLGGSRSFNVGQFGTGSVLQIDPSIGLKFQSSGNGYFQQQYDLNSSGQGIDLTQGGQDRFRLNFGDISMPSISILGLYATLPPNYSNYGVAVYLGDWDGMLLEFPFAAFPVSMSNAQKLTLDVGRNPPGASLILTSITTAGPPLAGDYDRNGVVDATDYDVWRRFFGISTKIAPTFPIASADGNADGRVDTADYIVWRRGLNSGPATAFAQGGSIPEPSSLVLLLCALDALRLFRLHRGASEYHRLGSDAL